MRVFTTEEQLEILKAEEQIRANGVIVDDVDGKEQVDHNAERIMAFFDLNKTIPVTVQTVLTAVQQMKEQLHWKSAAQIEYDKLYSELTEDQQNQFGSWWFKQRNTLILDDDLGFENAAQIIAWMKGKKFDARGLDLAVSNLAGSSRRPLHWAATREQTSSGRPGHAPSGAFAPKSDTNLTARDKARLTQEAAAKASGKSTPTPSTDYRALAEAITKGRTRLERLYVTRPGTSEILWQETYEARRRMAGL